mmetsp:Transcript_67680/g.153054  ORF Transcript_67680/g.153054 Transcript_67680/m.153054 type:complete len:324 (-) Transcript_67680:137-1108(-)
MRDPGKVQAQLLDQGPLVVHAPLGHVLPLARLVVLLHKRLHHAGPSRVATSRRPIRRGPKVCSCQDVRHGTLVPVDVVALAGAVGDVDADVREGAHLREDCVSQRLPAHDAPAPRSGVQVILIEVLVDGRINIPAHVPDLISALDDEAARVECLRTRGDGELGYQAGVVERRRHHVDLRDLRRRNGQCVWLLHRKWNSRRGLGPQAAVAHDQHGRQDGPEHHASCKGKWHRHHVLEEVLPPPLLLQPLQAAWEAGHVGGAAGSHDEVALGGNRRPLGALARGGFKVPRLRRPGGAAALRGPVEAHRGSAHHRVPGFARLARRV